MNYSTPTPISKSSVKSDFARYERKYANPFNTLSQFVELNLANMWDVARLSDAEMIVLKENVERKHEPLSLIILELKK